MLAGDNVKIRIAQRACNTRAAGHPRLDRSHDLVGILLTKKRQMIRNRRNWQSKMNPTLERRDSPRTKMFLAATISYGEESTPCQVRNMSTRGALVQAVCPPPKHATVILQKGTLFSTGEVSWRAGDLFGVHFNAEADPVAWLSGRKAENASKSSPTLPSHSAIEDTFSEEVVRLRIAEELSYISRTIENAAVILLNDPLLKARHAGVLQQLAITSEMLDDLQIVVKSDERFDSIAHKVRGPMRYRLLRGAHDAIR